MSFQTPLFKMFQRLFSIEVAQSVLIQKKKVVKTCQLSCRTYYFQSRHTVKALNINIKCQIYTMTWSL